MTKTIHLDVVDEGVGYSDAGDGELLAGGRCVEGDTARQIGGFFRADLGEDQVSIHAARGAAMIDALDKLADGSGRGFRRQLEKLTAGREVGFIVRCASLITPRHGAVRAIAAGTERA